MGQLTASVKKLLQSSKCLSLFSLACLLRPIPYLSNSPASQNLLCVCQIPAPPQGRTWHGAPPTLPLLASMWKGTMDIVLQLVQGLRTIQQLQLQQQQALQQQQQQQPQQQQLPLQLHQQPQPPPQQLLPLQALLDR